MHTMVFLWLHTYLGLFSLLGSLDLGLLFLGLTDGLLSLGETDLWKLVALGLDLVQASADNGPLVLDGLSAATLCRFLADALLVHATVDDGPVELAWLEFVQKVTFDLSVEETKDLHPWMLTME